MRLRQFGFIFPGRNKQLEFTNQKLPNWSVSTSNIAQWIELNDF